MAEKRSFRFLLSKPFHRGKHSRQKDSKDGDTSRHPNLVAPSNNAAREPTTMADVSKSPQTEPDPLMKKPKTQYAPSVPAACHDPAPTHSADGSARENSVRRESAVRIKPKILWDRAYDGLKEEHPRLVEAYEKVLSCELSGTLTASPASKDQQNIIEQKDTEMRKSQMKQLVDKGLGKTKHEARIKQGIGGVVDIVLHFNHMISTTLKSYPDAALAWTGITLALQASLLLENMVVDAYIFADAP